MTELSISTAVNAERIPVCILAPEIRRNGNKESPVFVQTSVVSLPKSHICPIAFTTDTKLSGELSAVAKSKASQEERPSFIPEM
jgi:hypothetical protein